jgi:hypothetical protein
MRASMRCIATATRTTLQWSSDRDRLRRNFDLEAAGHADLSNGLEHLVDQPLLTTDGGHLRLVAKADHGYAGERAHKVETHPVFRAVATTGWIRATAATTASMPATAHGKA